MKNFYKLMVVFGISLTVWGLGCGVKRPPKPLYSTPLPFEETEGLSNKTSPTPTPKANAQ